MYTGTIIVVEPNAFLAALGIENDKRSPGRAENSLRENFSYRRFYGQVCISNRRALLFCCSRFPRIGIAIIPSLSRAAVVLCAPFARTTGVAFNFAKAADRYSPLGTPEFPLLFRAENGSRYVQYRTWYWTNRYRPHTCTAAHLETLRSRSYLRFEWVCVCVCERSECVYAINHKTFLPPHESQTLAAGWTND